MSHGRMFGLDLWGEAVSGEHFMRAGQTGGSLGVGGHLHHLHHHHHLHQHHTKHLVIGPEVLLGVAPTPQEAGIEASIVKGSLHSTP